MSSAMKHQMQIPPASLHIRSLHLKSLHLNWLRLAALACLSATSGCTSVISSAYLREAWLDAVEHAADAKSEAERRPQGTNSDTASDTGASDNDASTDASQDDRTVEHSEAVIHADAEADTSTTSAAAAWSPATLDEAVSEADHRLAASGGLNSAARGTLIATLKTTPRQDWPVVVEEFTAALAAAHVDDAGEAAAAAVAKPVPPMPPTDAPRAESTPAPAAEAHYDAARPKPVTPPLAIQNACFASRVRAWGVVDRFETAEFEPGQELIVYFELDQLASRTSAEGHTTRIETVLRLVFEDGRRMHEWTFEPLEETCGSHRRDYFARYLVALPTATPAGPCRLEVAVTDTIAGRTAHATLPLTVVVR